MPGPIKSLVEFVVILAFAFTLVFGFVKPVIADSFYVDSGSMEPTLHGCDGCTNDRVLVNKLAYDLSDIERGDIVLFESPVDGDALIKRAVGLPGDNLEIRGGKLYLNGEPQEEPYLKANAWYSSPFGPVTVPEGHFFAMGDNRMNSTDSRSYGPVPEDHLIGEAEVRFWPPGRVGLF
ncbi:signal peptidase I [soil metagenome]